MTDGWPLHNLQYQRPPSHGAATTRCPHSIRRLSPVRDNTFYKAWDPISKDRDAFVAWIDKHVIGTADFTEYCQSVGIDG